MTSLHQWFESGRYSLLAHVELSEARGSTGVVIVPPFGWEAECSYRPLRFVARTLAQAGIPVLRFDLPGMGDSSGSELDSGLVDAWIQSVGDAADQLRAIAGVQEIAILGVGLGGLLSVVAASRGANVQDLVLWGAASCGHTVMRELNAYARMEGRELTSGVPTPPQPAPGLEVGGFLITPETQRDLNSLDVSALGCIGRLRTLLLSRDDLRPDQKLIDALGSSGCDLRADAGEGYEAMMGLPNEAIPPIATANRIAEFLAPRPGIDGSVPPNGPDQTVIESAGDAIVESVYTIPSGAGSLFGVLCEPAGEISRPDYCILFLNAGGVRHCGPNRMWVTAARRWAARGIRSLRLDLPGIGESDGESNLDIPKLYQERLVDEVELAMESLRTRLGVHCFVAIGLCSGAFWAFHAAIRDQSVRAAILMNPRLFFWDPEVDRRRLLKRGAEWLISPAEWLRQIRRGVLFTDLKRAARTLLNGNGASLAGAFLRRQIPPRKMAHAWKQLAGNGTRLALVFTEGEPLLGEMEMERQMPDPGNPRIQLVRVPNAEHTFRPKWAQKVALDLIDRELAEVVKAADTDPVGRVR